MDSSGTSGKTASNGVCDLVGRMPGRLVAGSNAARGDHPMLQVSEEKKTHYPYKEPRIDQRMYQAEIPALQGGDSNRAVTRGSSSPRAGEYPCKDQTVPKPGRRTAAGQEDGGGGASARLG